MKEPSVSNLATVRGIYAAFGRRDVPAILEYMAEDVVWEYGLNSTDVPWLQPRRGRHDVARFFESLAGVDFARLEATVKATGRQLVEEDEVHIWHFDASGRVARFRHRVDTLQHQLACQDR